MFASGAGGVHAWEASIETFNIYLMVSLSQSHSSCHKILTTVGCLSRCIHLCPLWFPSQTRSPHVLLPTLSSTMVQDLSLVNRCVHQRIYHWNILRCDVCLPSYCYELGCYNHRRQMYQQTWAVYRDRDNQHHQRCYPIHTTIANGFTTPDALQAEDWFDGHLYYWIFDGRHIDRAGLSLARNA